MLGEHGSLPDELSGAVLDLGLLFPMDVRRLDLSALLCLG